MIIANFMRVVSRYKTVRAPDTGFMVIGGKSEDKRQEERRGDLISKCEKIFVSSSCRGALWSRRRLALAAPDWSHHGHMAKYRPLIVQVRSKVCRGPDNLPVGVMSQL